MHERSSDDQLNADAAILKLLRLTQRVEWRRRQYDSCEAAESVPEVKQRADDTWSGGQFRAAGQNHRNWTAAHPKETDSPQCAGRSCSRNSLADTGEGFNEAEEHVNEPCNSPGRAFLSLNGTYVTSATRRQRLC
jgi:hypothetical protein